MASRRVACAPTFRGVRGPLAVVDLGAEAAGYEDVGGDLDLGSDSAKIDERRYEDKSPFRQTWFCSICSIYRIGIGGRA